MKPKLTIVDETVVEDTEFGGGSGGGGNDGEFDPGDAMEDAIEGVANAVAGMFEQFGRNAYSSATVTIEGISYEVAVSITEIK